MIRPEQVSVWLSEPRFQSYLAACSGEHDRAVALYNWNTATSAAFLETLCHVEVLLRNAIDWQFVRNPQVRHVSICNSYTWFTDGGLIEDQSRERVNEAITRLIQEGKPPTHDRVTASLSFGFWTALFSGRYEALWRSHLRHAFPNGNGRRREVNDCLQSIRRFRNRVAHHEPIFSLRLERQQRRQLKLARLIDEDAADYVAGISRIDDLLKAKPPTDDS